MRIAGKDTWLLSQLCATGASVVKDSPNSMANPQLSEGVIRKIHETNESTDKPLLQVLAVKRIDWGQSRTALDLRFSGTYLTCWVSERYMQAAAEKPW